MLLKPVAIDNNEIKLLLFFFLLADVQPFECNKFKILQYSLNFKDNNFGFKLYF